jgi:Membrane bound FAD containing D-sorbitol dehydrogenase
LGGGCAATLALAFPLPARTREVITVEQFRALSARLTGASPDALDVGAAAKLLDGFVSMGRGADLARLAADPGATGPLADDIVAAWYSGTYHTRNGLASFSLAGALLWGALDFTKPPGFCGPATGYWADAPRT